MAQEPIQYTEISDTGSGLEASFLARFPHAASALHTTRGKG